MFERSCVVLDASDVDEPPPPPPDGATRSLHELIVAEQQDFAAKLLRRRRRRHWLAAHQPLLRCLLGYCALHGAAGGGVVSVRMELSLLLQELLQPSPPSLHSPVPLPTTLPLLSAAVSAARSVVVDPLGHLAAMTHDVLKAVVGFDAPPRLWERAALVVTLRNIGGALSACLYQCLYDADSCVVGQRDAPAADVRMQGFTRWRHRSLVAEHTFFFFWFFCAKHTFCILRSNYWLCQLLRSESRLQSRLSAKKRCYCR